MILNQIWRLCKCISQKVLRLWYRFFITTSDLMFSMSWFELFSYRFAARYFSSSPPVFQRLFFTSEEAASIQYGPRRMKLRDLMGATLRFLQSDCEKFRVLWDWSACVSQLLTSDIMVRRYCQFEDQTQPFRKSRKSVSLLSFFLLCFWSYTAQCLALVSHMTDNQKTIFLRKVLSSEEILHLKMK